MIFLFKYIQNKGIFIDTFFLFIPNKISKTCSSTELYYIGMYLLFIIHKIFSPTFQFSIDQIKEILARPNISNQEILLNEMNVLDNLGGNLYSLTHIDCLEFVFFDNCLWHRNFKLLINFGKSILIK